MRKLRTAVLAGIATLGVAGTAMAASNDTHVMAVGLPDGSVARIEYQGAVAPKVRVDSSAPALRPMLRIVPVQLADPFDAAPFAMIDRIMADMDRQAAAMTAAAFQPVPAGKAGRPDLAAFGNLPAGAVSYRFVSTSDGNRVCTRSWQVTSQGPQQPPKLISASSGDCAGDGNSSPGTAGAGATAKTVAASKGAAVQPHDATPTI
ncbi:hypothetical protein [Sphingomonas sp.]|uniref:hypothetical protein n=1 Tax=Sphingomonas sp. TaxID=28214 RepID=UPI0026012406|nr:hypothetical protein [Sphingomonas sp.]